MSGEGKEAMDSREDPLMQAFVRLADTLVAEYDVIELCQQLVDDCVDILHVAEAGLLLGDHYDSLQVLASTSEQTRLMELFQLQGDSGPCLECYRTGVQVLVNDLVAEAIRWPIFGHRMLSDGYRAVYALPMRLRDKRIGALNLFCHSALTQADVRVGQALADVATIGIMHQRVLAEAEIVNAQLQIALNSRVIIEQAKGVVAERGHLDMDQAFDLIRSTARNSNQGLADVARAIVDGVIDIPRLQP